MCVLSSSHARCRNERCYLKKMDVAERVALWLGFADMTLCLSSQPVYCCLGIKMLFRYFHRASTDSDLCITPSLCIKHGGTVSLLCLLKYNTNFSNKFNWSLYQCLDVSLNVSFGGRFWPVGDLLYMLLVVGETYTDI